MRVQFIDATSRQRALKVAPWAARIVKVEGGYIAFESVDSYSTWLGQGELIRDRMRHHVREIEHSRKGAPKGGAA